MKSATPLEFAQHLGAAVSVLDSRKRQHTLQSWREQFAASVHARTGKWIHLGYEWHTFSYGFTRSKHGPRGLALYLAQSAADDVYVIPENEHHQAFTCGSRSLLDFTECRTDILVFPPNLDWTVAFTHEQPEFGPYFSRAEWCFLDPPVAP